MWIAIDKINRNKKNDNDKINDIKRVSLENCLFYWNRLWRYTSKPNVFFFKTKVFWFFVIFLRLASLATVSFYMRFSTRKFSEEKKHLFSCLFYGNVCHVSWLQCRRTFKAENIAAYYRFRRVMAWISDEACRLFDRNLQVFVNTDIIIHPYNIVGRLDHDGSAQRVKNAERNPLCPFYMGHGWMENGNLTSLEKYNCEILIHR